MVYFLPKTWNLLHRQMNSICISSFSNSKAGWVHLVSVFLYVWYNKYMDKNGVSHIEIKVTYDFRCVYSLQYHIVWCTKYPKKVFFGTIEKEVAGYSKEPPKTYRSVSFMWGFTIYSIITALVNPLQLYLSCQIQDSGYGMFCSILKYKYLRKGYFLAKSISSSPPVSR